MKTRKCLILLSVMVVLPVCGCGRSVAKADDSPAAVKESSSAESPTRYLTQCVRNPKTGRIETRRVPVDADTEAKPSTRYTTQRVRNPQTGEIITKRVPVDDTTTAARPCEPKAEKASPQPAKSAKPKPVPPQHAYAVRWGEQCSVEDAFEASAWVLESLGLAQDITRYRNRRIQNPRTGRIETRRVPDNSRAARSDGLSAYLEGNATAEIKFQIHILLTPPESSAMTIMATSTTQPEAVLEQQSLYLKEKISEAIVAEPAGPEAVPYPEMMILDCTVGQVGDAIYTWADKQGFERGKSGGRDKYYQLITCETGSGIRFEFILRLVESDQTKLGIDVSHYEGKEEFRMILQGLLEALEGVKAEPPQAAKEQMPCPETLVLNRSVDDVSGALGAWIKNMGFSPEQSYGDSFYRYVGCRTGSGIRLKFWMKLIDADKTKLQIRITDYERREDFPMILKSLEGVLAGLGADQSVAGEAAAADVFIAP